MGKKGGGNEAKDARREEQARQQRIREGTERVGSIFGEQFNPAYFDKQANNYMAYANPQLADQHGDAQKELAFSLARSGTLDSSARAGLESELTKAYDLNRRNIADQALNYKTTSMNSVEDARSNLISMLNATGDAEGAASGAIARAKALSQPPAYSPLANLFADFTSQLGTRAAQERAYAMSGGSGGGATLFGGGGSVRTRR